MRKKIIILFLLLLSICINSAGQNNMKIVFQTLLQTAFSDTAIKISRIEKLNESVFFNSCELYFIAIYSTDKTHLFNYILPSNQSYGYFAFYNNNLIYLHHNTEFIYQMVMENRNQQNINADKKRFVLFLYQILNKNHNESTILVQDMDDIKKYVADKKGYTINPSFTLFNQNFKGIFYISEDYSIIEFMVITGWMHQLKYLKKISIKFENKNTTISEEILYTDVFSSVPSIIY